MCSDERPLWGLTTYFNPSGYATRRRNYAQFRAHSQAQGVPLLTVELVPEGGTPSLTQGQDADVLLVKHSSAILWHKERLLNLGLDALPDACRYVCWVDADVLFEDDAWVEKTVAALQQHAVVQPFQTVIRLPNERPPGDFPSRRIGWTIRKGKGTGTYSRSFAAEWSKRPSASRLPPGTTGYAWCARRELLQRHGFYDRCIVGGGDREIALAFVKPSQDLAPSDVRIHHPRLRQHVAAWHDAVYAEVHGNLGVVAGTIHHLWHGDPKNRRYTDRHDLLAEHDYDPERHVVLAEDGCWRWADPAGPLALAVRDYLGSRKEDG